MKRFCSISLAAVCWASVGANCAFAEIIFESGTLGPTGVPQSAIHDWFIPGAEVSADVFVGVRFYVDRRVMTTQIGGHFLKDTRANESFLGAIIALDDESDFPASYDLSTPDVIGTTLLAFPELSDEVFGNLARWLDPGWYALVFGSGLFGATGSGVVVLDGTDIGGPSYFAFHSSVGWTNLGQSFFDRHRFFVVKGAFVPEPSSIVTTFIGVTLLLVCQRKGLENVNREKVPRL
jgi:hypothetical protein